MANDAGAVVRPAATLHVVPERVGAAAAAFRQAAQRVEALVQRARRGLLVEPLMADPVSREFADYVNRVHVESPGSYLRMIERYRDELHAVAASLAGSARSYEQVESDVAAGLR